MNATLKKGINWLFGWIKGADAWMLAGLFFSFIWFVIDWCLSTTFRPMSSPQLYLINFTASLVLLAPWMLTRNRIVGLTVILILDLLFEANLIYCRTYFTAIPPEGYLMAGNMKDFTDSIWPNLRWSDLGFVIILIITAIYSIRPKDSLSRLYNKSRSLRQYAALTCLSAMVSYVYVLCLGGFYKAYDTLIQDCKTYSSGVTIYTVAGHIVFKIMENERRQAPTPEELKSIDNWLQEHRSKYTPNQVDETKKSIVMIICESLESWPIGLSVNGKEITPFLNRLVSDSSTYFAPNVLTQVCAGRSIDGQLIYTTGLLPTSNAVYSMKYPDRNYPSLNKLIKKDRNAKSILMTTDKPITWNMLAVEKAFEYDTILCSDNWVDDEKIGRKITDGSFIRQSIAELKKGDLWPENTPAMLTFITCSGHSPFILPESLKDEDFDITNEGLPQILEDYITMTHYVDSQLGAIVDYVESRIDSEDTMIVILGDHEGLGESRTDILESSDKAEEFVDKGRHTPLIIVNSPVSGRYDGILGQADVFPTVLDMLGVSDEEWRGVGVSLLDKCRPDVAFSIIPPLMEGIEGKYDEEDVDHIRNGQYISEMIIMHDLLNSTSNH